MPSFWDRINPIGKNSWLNPIANKSFRKGAMNFLSGTPEERENVSLLRPEQELGFQQLQDAAQGRGAGGAFGTAADYYRDLMSNDSADYNAFAQPALRQYNEDIVPGISEQFAGMGSGGLSSSGFRNAQIQGATDLSERLGALRANLRQRGVEGLQNIGQLGLGNYSQNMVTKQGSPGLLGSIGPAVVSAGAGLIGGPGAAAATYPIAQQAFNRPQASSAGTTGPYGQNGPRASPQIGNQGFQLPNFMQR